MTSRYRSEPDLEEQYKIPPSLQRQAAPRKETEPDNETSMELNIVKCLFILFNSLIFGFLLEKSKVFQPEVIQGQMTLHNWRMMKFFLLFVGANQILLGLVALIPKDGESWYNKFSSHVHYLRQFHGGKPSLDEKLDNSQEEQHVFKSMRGPLPTMFGAMILGAGMAIAGACPGTIYVQAGVGMKSGGIALAGGLFGAFIFALMQGMLINTKFWTIGQRFFIDNYGIGGRYYSALALPAGVLVTGIGVALNWLTTSANNMDYYQQPPEQPKQTNILTQSEWNPYICGTLAAVLVMLPQVGWLRSSCGMSITYPAFFAWLFPKPIAGYFFFDKPNDVLDMKFPSFNWLNKIVSATGVFLGGLTSSMFSQNFAKYQDFSNVQRSDRLLLWPGSDSVRVLQPLIGGFMVVIGARIAGGCTSGHGISGLSLLRASSVIIAVPFMFIGGIATGISMQGAIRHKLF